MTLTLFLSDLISEGEITMKYRLKNEYKIDAPSDIIWDTICDVEAWPDVWKYIRKMRLRGDEETIRMNTIIDCEVMAFLPYVFRFSTEIIKLVPYKELEVISRGDLVGSGLWTLDHKMENITQSSFIWDVEPQNQLTRTIARIPLGKHLLCYGHNCVMENGYQSLLTLLELNKKHESV